MGLHKLQLNCIINFIFNTASNICIKISRLDILNSFQYSWYNWPNNFMKCIHQLLITNHWPLWYWSTITVDTWRTKLRMIIDYHLAISMKAKIQQHSWQYFCYLDTTSVLNRVEQIVQSIATSLISMIMISDRTHPLLSTINDLCRSCELLINDRAHDASYTTFSRQLRNNAHSVCSPPSSTNFS